MTYYRLKQIDFDGTFTYSKIISVESFLTYDVKIYPIPVDNGVLNISTKNHTALIKILDLFGKLSYESELKNNFIEIYLNDFSKGVYFINVISNDNILIKKIVIN